jgi:uncharacterized membrane protein YkoI
MTPRWMLVLFATVLCLDAAPRPAFAMSAKEMVALQEAKVTLQDAIVTAQQQVPGGRVIDADIGAVKGGKVTYAIKILKDGEHLVRVDPQNGAVLSKSNRVISPKDWKDMARIEQAKVTMAEAVVTAASKLPGGKLASAGVKEERGNIRYQIDIVTDGVHVVEIDPEDGRVLRVAKEMDD